MAEHDEAEAGGEDEETAGAETAVAEESDYQLSIDAKVETVGPCRKHVSVTVPRADIDHFYGEAIGEFSETAAVPGFRVGHAPKKLVERRFKQELSDQVKQKLLMESLERVSEVHELDPINEPNIDVEAIEIPDEGDFVFEFDVEVRPEFDLPDYKGLKIRRPIREVTDDEVDAYTERFLSQYGQLVPHDGPAESGDYVVTSIAFTHDGKPLRKLQEITVRLSPVLRFQDAELEGFDELMAGVSADETREAELTVSQEAESIEMRGETVQAVFTVLDVKRSRPPELTKELLAGLGVETEDELREEIEGMLERRRGYEQRQRTREQVLEKITESADWDLPEKLVLRQVENALRREILEMQQAGFTTQEIRARENEIRQRAVSTTRQALKEHFVLDKIATQEDIETLNSDIDLEIQMMALQRGESARRVRARIEKSGMIDNLDAQIRERKAVEFILEHAEFEDVPMEPLEEGRVEAVSQSVCGAPSTSGAEEEADDEE